VESAGIAVQLRARPTSKLLFLQSLELEKRADSAIVSGRENRQIANALTDSEPPHANILTLELQF
jgi:hypothetical protein